MNPARIRISPSSTAALAAAGLAVVLLAGCSSSGGTTATTAPTVSASASVSAAASAAQLSTPADSSPAGESDSVTGGITVLAAASLTGAFTQLGKNFEAAHPGVKVTFDFGSSGDLATSIVGGAPGDVFAAASPKTMQTVVTAKQATSPVTFASNSLEIATPPSNPGKVGSLADLSKSGLKLALCAASAPCGATAITMLTRDKITVHPSTFEPDVKSTLAKVSAGEVDAGIVYVTDVQAAGKQVHGVAIPTAQNQTTAYPIAPLEDSRNAATAAAFATFVASAPSLAVLKAAGFAAP